MNKINLDISLLQIVAIQVIDNKNQLNDIKLVSKIYTMAIDQNYIYIVTEQFILCIIKDQQLYSKLQLKTRIKKPDYLINNEYSQEICKLLNITEQQTQFIDEQRMNNVDTSQIQIDQEQNNNQVNYQLIKQCKFLLNQDKNQLEQILNQENNKQEKTDKQENKKQDKQIIQEYKPKLNLKDAQKQVYDDGYDKAIFYAKLNKQKKEYELQKYDENKFDFDENFYYIYPEEDDNIQKCLEENNVYYEIVEAYNEKQVLQDILQKNNLQQAIFVKKQDDLTQKQIYDDFKQYINITKIKTINIENQDYCICVYDNYLDKQQKKHLNKYQYEDISK